MITAPTATLEYSAFPNSAELPTLIDAFITPNIITGKSIHTVLKEYNSSARLCIQLYAWLISAISAKYSSNLV